MKTLMRIMAALALLSSFAAHADINAPAKVLSTAGVVGVGDQVCLRLGTGQATVLVNVSGFGTATVTVYVQSGVSPFSAVNVTSVGTTPVLSSSITANGLYRFDGASYSNVCAVLTSGTSQSITTQIFASTAPITGGVGVVNTTITTPPCGAASTVGGDAGSGNYVLWANDGGSNRGYFAALTITTNGTGSGIEIVDGPPANTCATDGGASSIQNVLYNGYMMNGGIWPPFSFISKTPGNSVCVFQDGGPTAFSEVACPGQ